MPVPLHVITKSNEPYPGMTIAEVHSKVKEGFRMILPPQIPNNVRIVILNCWGLPDKRWSANEVAKKFEEISGLKMPEYVTLEEKKKQQQQILTTSNGPAKRKKSKTSRESRDSVEQQENGDDKPQRNKNSAGSTAAGNLRRSRTASS
uniref:Serine-threonine/tyrosine-protein kinase catalytic domain-containing protein n=1 Tax=Panagrolaimus superbus TaxID=310955 RepID=A0A914XXX4_9BILA